LQSLSQGPLAGAAMVEVLGLYMEQAEGL